MQILSRSMLISLPLFLSTSQFFDLAANNRCRKLLIQNEDHPRSLYRVEKWEPGKKPQLKALPAGEPDKVIYSPGLDSETSFVLALQGDTLFAIRSVYGKKPKVQEIGRVEAVKARRTNFLALLNQNTQPFRTLRLYTPPEDEPNGGFVGIPIEASSELTPDLIQLSDSGLLTWYEDEKEFRGKLFGRDKYQYYPKDALAVKATTRGVLVYREDKEEEEFVIELFSWKEFSMVELFRSKHPIDLRDVKASDNLVGWKRDGGIEVVEIVNFSKDRPTVQDFQIDEMPRLIFNSAEDFWLTNQGLLYTSTVENSRRLNYIGIYHDSGNAENSRPLVPRRIFEYLNIREVKGIRVTGSILTFIGPDLLYTLSLDALYRVDLNDPTAEPKPIVSTSNPEWNKDDFLNAMSTKSGEVFLPKSGRLFYIASGSNNVEELSLPFSLRAISSPGQTLYPFGAHHEIHFPDSDDEWLFPPRP